MSVLSTIASHLALAPSRRRDTIGHRSCPRRAGHYALTMTDIVSAAAASARAPLPAPRDPKLRRMADAIRALAMDAVEKARCGHPGMPMGMADIATVLWTQIPQIRPASARLARPRPLRAVGRARLDAALRAPAPHRLSRHDDGPSSSASASSAAAPPAIPSAAMRSGIETTTGPLGQGLANSVGMALAERLLAAALRRRPSSITTPM